MPDKNRPLAIFQYLWNHTDESRPAIITEILAYLEAQGIHADRKTVAADIRDLQEAGWDIICNRSRQNQYFIGDRGLELAELKLIIDAVQAARFISPHKTETIVEKLTQMGRSFRPGGTPPPSVRPGKGQNHQRGCPIHH